MASNQISSTRIHFITLTVLAVVLLQGLLIANGAFYALLKDIYYGKFEDGKRLHRIYTGMPVVDELLAMSVSFWDGVATLMPVLRLESVMLSASLQTFALWATVERMRIGKKHTILRFAPIYMFCCQYLGTAIFVPFYCFVELNRHFNPNEVSDPSVPYLQAKSLLPAAIIGFLHPYRLVYFTPSGTTTSQHQTFIANYQLGPFITYALVATFTNYLSSDHQNEKPYPKNADAPWIKVVYAFFGMFSTITHLSVIGKVLTSRDRAVNLTSLFVPAFGKIWLVDAAASRFVEESLYFLQWDFILVVLACSIWVTRITEIMYTVRGGTGNGWLGVKSAALVLFFGIACVLFSPGGVVSAVLYEREDFLRQEWIRKQERETLQGDEKSSEVQMQL